MSGDKSAAERLINRPNKPAPGVGEASWVRIHGLSAQRYREIYSSVFTPDVLAALSSCTEHTEYVSQVQELKQQLWMKLGRPQLHETVMEDGRVEVKEIFDLS